MNVPIVNTKYRNIHTNQLCSIVWASEEWTQICLDIKFKGSRGASKNGTKKWDEIETTIFLAHWTKHNEENTNVNL